MEPLAPNPFLALLDALQEVVNDAKIGVVKATADAIRSKTLHDPLKGRTLLIVKTASGTLSYTVQQPDEALAMATRMAAKEPVDIFDGHTQERLVSLGQGQMINNLIPDDVLDAMASAMLDPALRIPDKVPNAEGNKVRIRALSRALAAAEELGWVMVKAETGK